MFPSFTLDSEQQKKLKEFLDKARQEIVARQLANENFDEQTRKNIEESGRPWVGAIGGELTYSFTPTSLGLITKVTYFDQEIDLSDYDTW